MKMIRNRLKQLYVVWFILATATLIYSIWTGEYQQMMRAAVDMVPEQQLDMDKSKMTFFFCLISISVFLTQALVGWILLYFALDSRTWGKVLFLLFSIFMIYNQINNSIFLPQQYPQFYEDRMDHILNWLSCVFTALVFSYISFTLVGPNEQNNSAN